MTVTITTDGGFTGRGIGSVSVDTRDDDHVREALARAHPESWQREYTAHGADLINYTLTAGEHTTSFQTGAAIPQDLEELFEIVWSRK